jgi:hypothetical protein
LLLCSEWWIASFFRKQFCTWKMSGSLLVKNVFFKIKWRQTTTEILKAFWIFLEKLKTYSNNYVVIYAFVPLHLFPAGETVCFHWYHSISAIWSGFIVSKSRVTCEIFQFLATASLISSAGVSRFSRNMSTQT